MSIFEKYGAFKGSNWSTLKREVKGANAFLLKVGPFSEGRQINFDSIASPESVSISLNVKNTTWDYEEE